MAPIDLWRGRSMGIPVYESKIKEQGSILLPCSLKKDTTQYLSISAMVKATEFFTAMGRKCS